MFLAYLHLYHQEVNTLIHTITIPKFFQLHTNLSPCISNGQNYPCPQPLSQPSHSLQVVAPPPPLTRFCSLPDCCQADLRVFLVSSLVCIIVHAWLSYGIRLLFKILFFFFGRQEQGKTVNCIGH